MRLENNINGRSIALFLILAVLVRQFVQSSTGFYSVVQGESMDPTFRNNDVVQTHALHERPKRGDVVIITDDRCELAIKRVIGLPGESVTIILGFVYINGQRLSEPYLPKLTYTFILDNQASGSGSWRLAGDQYFVLGDNRLQSIDSRNFGPVDFNRVRRMVELPENSPRPEFGDVILSVSGLPMRKQQLSRESTL
jgi:signal peptidase I